MKISQRGINLIKSFEGLRNHAYKPVDTEEFYTIGYGHYSKAIMKDDRISDTDAEKLLRDDLKKFEDGVNDLLRVTINQNQFDALVSFAFNVGLGALKSSTLLRMVNSKSFTGASVQFERWNRAGGHVLEGLVTRRRAERLLFETPVKTLTETHKVKSGQTLHGLAITYKTTVNELLKLNPSIKNANLIKIGQAIKVPKK